MALHLSLGVKPGSSLCGAVLWAGRRIRAEEMLCFALPPECFALKVNP